MSMMEKLLVVIKFFFYLPIQPSNLEVVSMLRKSLLVIVKMEELMLMETNL